MGIFGKPRIKSDARRLADEAQERERQWREFLIKQGLPVDNLQINLGDASAKYWYYQLGRATGERIAWQAVTEIFEEWNKES